jgi:type II secretion system protein I
MDSRTAIAADNNLKRKSSGFTLVEVLVTTVIVALALVGVLGAISSETKAEAYANDAILLQRLANEKLNDLRVLQDPSDDGGNGDFSDRGYPDVTWSADVETSSTENLDQVEVTATRGKSSQSITTLIYVIPATSTSTTTTGTTTP